MTFILSHSQFWHVYYTGYAVMTGCVLVYSVTVATKNRIYD